ncbi:MAG: hypothetical protein IPL86_16440 [Flavobacteriales bacterium]|nr:hypothetical protein [Flavobacteriales bacterium]
MEELMEPTSSKVKALKTEPQIKEMRLTQAIMIPRAQQSQHLTLLRSSEFEMRKEGDTVTVQEKGGKGARYALPWSSVAWVRVSD